MKTHSDGKRIKTNNRRRGMKIWRIGSHEQENEDFNQDMSNESFRMLERKEISCTISVRSVAANNESRVRD